MFKYLKSFIKRISKSSGYLLAGLGMIALASLMGFYIYLTPAIVMGIGALGISLGVAVPLMFLASFLGMMSVLAFPIAVVGLVLVVAGIFKFFRGSHDKVSAAEEPGSEVEKSAVDTKKDASTTKLPQEQASLPQVTRPVTEKPKVRFSAPVGVSKDQRLRALRGDQALAGAFTKRKHKRSKAHTSSHRGIPRLPR